MASTRSTRIIIDAQLLQTSDRQRGMGFFLTSLLTALHGAKTEDVEWVFVLNRNLSSLDPADHRLLAGFGGQILDVDLLTKSDRDLFGDAAATNRGRLDGALDKLAGDFVKTIFFIPALYSSDIYPVFPTAGTANILLKHDIIPFLYYREYFRDPEGPQRIDYAQRCRELYKADMIVTNSQTTADDLTVYFGLDPSRLTPIFGAGADRDNLNPEEPKIGRQLAGGFVLMPSGDDFRKNNTRAVQAFAALKTDLKLVITSKFSEESKRQLRDLAPNLVFSGPVSDGEYLWLLDHADAVFFPTEYEGLGMPVLEAIDRNALVACSNIPVFAEISQEAFFNFDPLSVSDMSEALKKVLGASVKTRQQKTAAYGPITNRFTWAKSAALFMDAARRCVSAGPRKKLAVFCPSPSSYSAVGKYAFEVHAELSRYYDIDYYAEGGFTNFEPTRPNILEYAANYYDAASFDPGRRNDYDQILYHIGNSEFHVSTILDALRLPATAIIHDTRLDGIFDYLTNHGFMPAGRRRLEAKLDEKFKCRKSSHLVSIATNQELVFCHSTYAREAVGETVLAGRPRISQVAHPIGVPAIHISNRGEQYVSFAGIISESKGINLVAAVSQLEGVQVRVFGFGALGDSPLLQDLSSNVQVIKDLTDKQFQDTLSRSAILVNYRIRYHGETSRSTLEAMRHGAVVIVRNEGWYAELPDDVVVKVNSETEVLTAVKRLLSDPASRQKIAGAAREFLRSEYSYATYARELATHLEGATT